MRSEPAALAENYSIQLVNREVSYGTHNPVIVVATDAKQVLANAQAADLEMVKEDHPQGVSPVK